jgi:Ni,Fe-hydrogenase III small subunit/formate hydrogenlyase subunit 6/NADH:ubiquinone oxidoreductase subunit I
MLRILKRMLSTGIATNAYPAVVEEPPDGFFGKPVIDFSRCSPGPAYAAVCPTGAIDWTTDTTGGGVLAIDYGQCIFCGACAMQYPGVISMSKEFQLAAPSRAALVASARYRQTGAGTYAFEQMLHDAHVDGEAFEAIGQQVKEEIWKLYGRSLHIREVDAGSCNGCEVEITALNNPVYDIERFGVHFVASPRHADMLLVTGPVSHNMEIALKQTYDATPEPKLVVAVGACAIGGGVFGKSYASRGGVDTTVPVDVYIPGCPPRPEALLHGILAAIRRPSFSQK